MKRSAPAKINLGLAVGPVRPDGRHDLVTVMQAITLCDELELTDGGAEDRVDCPGIEGENLALEALTALRERSGWDGPGQHLRIDKRIPVAAGLAGGSSDAAAALALAAVRAGIADEDLVREVARDLGSDVAGLLSPGRWLAAGAGDELEELPSPVGLWVLVLPADHGLSTADVYARADEIGARRSLAELDELAQRLLDELAGGADLPAGRASRATTSKMRRSPWIRRSPRRSNAPPAPVQTTRWSPVPGPP